jgi:hypothetical protein
MSNAEEKYPSGPDISSEFSPPGKLDMAHPLPVAFDTKCTNCEVEMERRQGTFCTRWKPFAHFHCDPCNRDLYLFATNDPPPHDTLYVWSERLSGLGDFSKAIDALLLKRREEEVRKQVRKQGYYAPQ